jgi:hypothetical protein
MTCPRRDVAADPMVTARRHRSFLFTSALRSGAGNNIPSASRLLCDPPNVPTHLDCTTPIPNSVAPVSRVGAASCRGA